MLIFQRKNVSEKTDKEKMLQSNEPVESLVKQLTTKGSQILINVDEAFSFPFFLKIDFPIFVSMTNTVFNSSDINTLTGFNQSFAFYISENFLNHDFDLSFIWNTILLLSNIVLDPINIKFLCDSIYQILIRTKEIDPRLLQLTGIIFDEEIQFEFDFTNFSILPFILNTISEFLEEKEEDSIERSIKLAALLKNDQSTNLSYRKNFFVNDELKLNFLDIFCQSFVSPFERDEEFVGKMNEIFTTEDSKKKANTIFHSQRTELLQLIPKIYTANELYSNPNFCQLLWDQIIHVSTKFDTIDDFNENEYLSMMKIISTFCKDFPDLFVYDPPISTLISSVQKQIKKKIEIDGDEREKTTTKIDILDLTKLMFLLPFMNQIRIKFIIKHLIRYTREYFLHQKNYPKFDFITTLNRTAIFPNQSDTFLFLFKSINDKKQNHELEAIYVLSCFLEYLEPSNLIQSRNFFTNCTSLLQKTDMQYHLIIFKALINLVKSSIAVPSDLSAFIENDIVNFFSNETEPTKTVMKFLKTCVSNDISTIPILSLLINSGIPNNPLLFKPIFEIYQELVLYFEDCEEDEEKLQKRDELFSFLSSLMEDEHLPNQVKAYLLGVIDIAAEIMPDFMMGFLDDSFHILEDVLKNFQDFDCVSFALEYLKDALEMLVSPLDYLEQFFPIFNELLRISNGEKRISSLSEKESNQIIRLAAREAVSCAQKLLKGEINEKDVQKLVFPFSIIQKFLETKNPTFVWYATSTVAINIQFYTNEQISTAFRSILELDFHSKDSILMNKTLELCQSISQIELFNVLIPEIDAFIHSVFLARFPFFDGSQMFDFVPRNFKLYDAINTFIQKNHLVFVPHMMVSIDFIPNDLFPQLSSCLLTFLEHDQSVESDLQYIYSHVLQRIVQMLNDIYVQNEEIEDFLIPFVELLSIIIKRGVSDVNIGLFMECLYKLWEKNLSQNTELIVETIFSIIDLQFPDLHINQHIIFNIIQSIYSFQFEELDYNEVILMTISIFHKHVPEYQLEQSFGILYANLMMMSEEELQAHNIECQEQMSFCLSQLSENQPRLANEILSKFHKDQENYQLLETLLSSNAQYNVIETKDNEEEDNE